MYKTIDILKKFTDVFNKDSNSNLGKIIQIFSQQLQDLETTNIRIKEWRLIDNAEGVALDLIGENIQQPRGIATDEVYRVLLKSKIARNLSTSDINTIIRVLSLALDADPSTIRIQEKWNDPTEPEPAAIKVIEVPLAKINESGLAPEQFVKIIQKTVAAGVKVASIELTGTFEFGGLPMETDAAAGFSDVDGTTGGYFGAAFEPSSDQELPI
ncbi:hypothetical protein [Indiicoccus explosivorum]|uniref:hypothetical protein n=1 Tax=Indiicoccus explosivorum TaxID=1917864 RepID=UPI000B449E85|nr:hypothetical protein [Indiicoccus explosivorum]